MAGPFACIKPSYMDLMLPDLEAFSMEEPVITNTLWHIVWLSADVQNWLFLGHLGCSVMDLAFISLGP